jgi:hypothetical protein
MMVITGLTDDAMEKLQRCQELFTNVYYESSVIHSLVQTRDAMERDENFLKIYRRTYMPKEWFNRTDHYPDLVFRRFGANLALSEKKYVLEEILENENIEQIEIEREIQFADLRNALLHLSERQRDTPLILFLPISYYTQFHIDWIRENPHQLTIRYPQGATILGLNLRIFWSNKYMPFDEFIIIDTSFGLWISKPSFRNRLQVTIDDSDREDQLDFLAFTTFKFDIIDENRIIKIKGTNV